MRSLLIGRFVLVQRGRTDQLEARGPRVVTHTRITERIPILLPIKNIASSGRLWHLNRYL